MLDVNRKELKYIIGTEEVSFLRGKLEKIMEPDPHNGENGYIVRSLYFDTLSDSDYQEKEDGLNHRKKIRLRIYGDSVRTIKLELKEKSADYQRKRSLLLTEEEARQMMDSDYLFLLERPEGFAHAMYTLLSTHGYQPKCIVEYDRAAYIHEHNDIRVTFDMNLRAMEGYWDFLDGKRLLYPVTSPAETTMEIKYNGLLFSYIRQAVSHADKVRISNSKYCRARKAMR